MGRQASDLAVVTPLPGLNVADTVTMTTNQALTKLSEFARLNGFNQAEYTDTLTLFLHAANQPGVAYIVPTVYEAAAMAAARRQHALMDAITSDPVASELALRATGAAPGTHFNHSLRGDACELTLECTNAR